MNRSLIILFLLLFAIFGGVFFVVPKNKNLILLKEKIQQKIIELETKEEYFSSLYQLYQKTKDYQDSLFKVELAVPDDPELPALFDFFQKSVSQAGLVLNKIELISADFPRQSKQVSIEEILVISSKTPVREIYLNLNVNGSYSAFKNFLSILERSARLIEIESINVVTWEDWGVSAQIKLKTHSL